MNVIPSHSKGSPRILVSPRTTNFYGLPIDGSKARTSFVYAHEPSSRAHVVQCQGHVACVHVLSQQYKREHIFGFEDLYIL